MPRSAPIFHSRSSILSFSCWVLSALAIGGSLVWIVVAEDKGVAIFSGIVAVGIARVLIGDVAQRQDGRHDERHDERAAATAEDDAET